MFGIIILVLKGFYYQHIHRKWLLDSFKARNVCYDAALHGSRERTALTTKKISPVSYEKFFS